MSPITRWLSFALFLSLAAVAFSFRPAFADPPPWAPAHGYRHHHHDHDDDDDDDWWKHHERDEWKHDRWKREHRGDDARCGEILDRMRFNRAKIREIEPTGRHRKALQWYKDDTDNARKDLDRCRHGG
jgi:Spy/CpxP family protein refolding chaperone